jgi:TRAP-type uncharacterized transport system substrate-binding protein
MSQQIQDQTDGGIRISVQETGGFDANVRRVGSGGLDMAATSTPNFQWADLARGPFENEFSVAPLFTNAVYPFPIAFGKQGNDVDFIADLQGKSMVTGPPGSSVHTNIRLYFLANDLDWEGTEKVRVGGQEAYQNLKQGKVEAVVTAGINNVVGPAAQQFIQTGDGPKLVPPRSKERVDRLVNARDYLEEVKIQGGVNWTLSLEQFGAAWENSAISDQDTFDIVAGTNTHFATLDMGDEIARQITDISIKQREALADGTALWAAFAEEPSRYAALLPMADAESQPWHPGAVEAMKENDVWDDSMPVAQR